MPIHSFHRTPLNPSGTDVAILKDGKYLEAAAERFNVPADRRELSVLRTLNPRDVLLCRAKPLRKLSLREPKTELHELVDALLDESLLAVAVLLRRTQPQRTECWNNIRAAATEAERARLVPQPYSSTPGGRSFVLSPNPNYELSRSPKMFRRLLLLSVAAASLIGFTVVGSGSALADGQSGQVKECGATGNFRVINGTIQILPIAGNGGCFGISPTEKIWWTNGRGGAWQLMPGNGRASEVSGSDIECGLQYVYVVGPGGPAADRYWAQYWSAGHWDGRWIGPLSANNPPECPGI